MEFTGEFFMPEQHGNIEIEHVHRYLFAAELVVGSAVLDIASGEGYGSEMLASYAASVIGVDISEHQVNLARSRHQRDNLSFRVGSCSAIPVDDSTIDVVVSFETIEHHDEHEEMMREIKRVLRPNGVLVISSPDKYRYSIEPKYTNPFHVKELYDDEFKSLISRYFNNSQFVGQRIVYGSSIVSSQDAHVQRHYWKGANPGEYFSGDNRPLYWIAVASDGALPPTRCGVFEVPIDDSETAIALRQAIQTLEIQAANLRARAIEESTRRQTAQMKLDDVSRRMQILLADLAELQAERSAAQNKGAHYERQLNNLRKYHAEALQFIVEQQKEITRLTGNLGGKRSTFLLGRVDGDMPGPSVRRGLIDVATRAIALIRTPGERPASSSGGLHGDPVPALEVPGFNAADYLEMYPEVAADGWNPLDHYVLHGAAEGRLGQKQPLDEEEIKSFNAAEYLEMYPEVAADGWNPLDHYVLHGAAEGRLGRKPSWMGSRSNDAEPPSSLPELSLPESAPDYRPLVTVIVPAYNHADYLPARLDSVYHQTYAGQVEFILLDDASEDGSADILEEYTDKYSDTTILIRNPANTGSAFYQWKKGLSLAKGELVWIAESDDLCDRHFLQTLVPLMANPAVMVAFCRTTFFQTDTDEVIWTMEEYLRDCPNLHFDRTWIRTAEDVVRNGFSEKNIIPNVSGALLRNPGAMPLMNDQEWLAMRLAGDWVFYLELIKCGLVGYSPDATNYHRCSDITLTSQHTNSEIFSNELTAVNKTINRLYRRAIEAPTAKAIAHGD